jgi:hypothetical protein
MMTVLALRPWAHVTVREGERVRRTGMEDNGNAVSTWPHMAKTEKGEKGNIGGRR